MSFERRNIDFAFPSFAPGLPSVYERAGFDVRQPSPSVRSRASSKSARSARSGQHLANNFPAPSTLAMGGGQMSPQYASPRSAPSRLSNRSQAQDEARPPMPPSPAVAAIPPRAPSRSHHPLSVDTVQANKKSSVSSSGTEFSRDSSNSRDSSTHVSPNSSIGDEFNFEPPKHNQQGRFSTTSSIYSVDSPRLSLAPAKGCPYPRTPDTPTNPQFHVAKASMVGETPSSAPTGASVASVASALPASVTPVAPNSAPAMGATAPPLPSTPLNSQTIPPKAPEHARRASDLQAIHTHSSSSSQSSVSSKQCRGCRQVIIGRSVYSKDGNMSGRWHKQCFCCTGCSTKLTAEVYVLQDLPYCKDCYHFSNKSLCATCEQGIEGPCLESWDHSSLTRFHPACLSCAVCEIHLTEYYEAAGRIYCDRHVVSASQARKRTTRLITDLI